MTEPNSIFAEGITQDYLSQCFEYDPETGSLKWKRRPRSHFNTDMHFHTWNGRYPGREVGWVAKVGYKQTNLKGKKFYLHRIVWFMVYGYVPEQIDHINHDTLDNRAENLRPSDNTSNGHNQSMKRNNKSGVTGVFWCRRDACWWAYINKHGRRHFLGTFGDFELAVAARKKAEADMGFHKNHGRLSEKRRTNAKARSAL